MSPKEQSQALVLLQEMLSAMETRVAQSPTPEHVDLVERARKFVSLPATDEPESHGKRRRR